MSVEAVLGVVRHLLTFGGGFLVAKGWVDAPGLEVLVGGLVTVLGGAWSVYQKSQAAAE